eukprot:jgi/Undpi1/13359/HiC_scaffold_8.g03018.m1
MGRRTGAPSAFAGKALTNAAVAPAAGSAPGLAGARWGTPAFAHGDSTTRMLFSNPFKKKEVNYEELEGAAGEAAKAALVGEVPSKSEDGKDIATFAGGCFWGLELAFQRVPGVGGTSVGYTQGAVDKPTYGEVCSGSTAHTEAVQVFFGRIDPTQKDGQGGDWGTQYRTGVYYHTDEQEATAKKFMEGEQGKHSRPVATECKKATVYWPAELYHQQYLSKGGRFGQPQSSEKGATETIRCYG